MTLAKSSFALSFLMRPRSAIGLDYSLPSSTLLRGIFLPRFTWVLFQVHITLFRHLKGWKPKVGLQIELVKPVDKDV